LQDALGEINDAAMTRLAEGLAADKHLELAPPWPPFPQAKGARLAAL
jgi:hypothetical protein